MDVYEKADILDLIHAVQINCECSPLDKENSHFIMCDLTIAANELMKTQEIEDNLDYETIQLTKSRPTHLNTHTSKAQHGSTSIKINDKSITSSNLFSSFDNSVSNSCVSTIQNSPQQLFFALESAADPVDDSVSNSSLNYMNGNFNGEAANTSFSNGSEYSALVVSPKEKNHSKKAKNGKHSFNRSFSSSTNSGLNNINEVDAAYVEQPKLSSSATIVCIIITRCILRMKY